jgi:hypothetical protein
VQVELDGEEVYWVDAASRLPDALLSELQWVWGALNTCARIRSLVLIYE